MKQILREAGREGRFTPLVVEDSTQGASMQGEKQPSLYHCERPLSITMTRSSSTSTIMTARLAPRQRDVFLIWGANGWIAGQLKELLEKTGKAVYTTSIRMEDREAVLDLLRRIKPTHVLNCAGSTGRPNVDWCEDHTEEVIRSNVVGTVNLTDCCFMENIHITVFGTGCMIPFRPIPVRIRPTDITISRPLQVRLYPSPGWQRLHRKRSPQLLRILLLRYQGLRGSSKPLLLLSPFRH